MGTLLRLPLRRLLVAILIVAAASVQPATRVASHGTFSTNDFAVAWPDRWQAIQETDTNLVLSDGLTQIHLVGVFDARTPEDSVPDLVYDWFTHVITGEDIVEVEPVTTLGPDRAFTVYTYRYRVDSQRLDPYAVYFEARRITPDLILWFVVDAHLGLYRADPTVFATMIATLHIDGAAPTSPPAQSFASGPWHIAVPSVLMGRSIPSLGLGSVPGHAWVVMLIDLANASDAARSFPVESAVIETDDGTRVAPSSIDSYLINSTLQLDDSLVSGAEMSPGSLARLALVYQLPEEAVGLTFSVAEHGIAIESLIDPEFGVATMPPSPRMPSLQSGVIEGWTGSNAVRVRMDDGAVRDIALLGASIPAPSACYGQETSAFVQSLIGTNVAIEHDPAVVSTNYAYLWIDHPSGEPALLNHQLLDLGFARTVAIPEDARFSLWLRQTADAAQQQRTGQWEVCQ